MAAIKSATTTSMLAITPVGLAGAVTIGTTGVVVGTGMAVKITGVAVGTTVTDGMTMKGVAIICPEDRSIRYSVHSPVGRSRATVNVPSKFPYSSALPRSSLLVESGR